MQTLQKGAENVGANECHGGRAKTPLLEAGVGILVCTASTKRSGSYNSSLLRSTMDHSMTFPRTSPTIFDTELQVLVMSLALKMLLALKMSLALETSLVLEMAPLK